MSVNNQNQQTKTALESSKIVRYWHLVGKTLENEVLYTLPS